MCIKPGIVGLSPGYYNLQDESAAFSYTVNLTQIWGNDIFILKYIVGVNSYFSQEISCFLFGYSPRLLLLLHCLRGVTFRCTMLIKRKKSTVFKKKLHIIFWSVFSFTVFIFQHSNSGWTFNKSYLVTKY